MSGPVVAIARGEQSGEARLKRGPVLAIKLRRLIRRQAQTVDEGRVEAGLQRPYGDETAVPAGVAAIEGRAAVQQIGLAPVAPQAARAQGVEQAGQQGRAVGHGCIDDASAPGGLRLQQGRQHAADQHHGPAAVVADQVQRGRGRLIARAHRIEGAGQGDVVDVVADLIRHWPRLAPTGDAAVD
ncbi:hypothetical protein D3C81_1653910 [compost metagenome]